MKTDLIRLYENREDVTLTCYLWDDSPELLNGKKRPAVLICPGGAYLGCSDREGEPVALRFASMGYHAFVLRYSTYTEGKNGPVDCSVPLSPKPRLTHPAPMREIGQAMLILREHAEDWFLDAERIAICGFSAGAHNCAMYATHWHTAELCGHFGRPSALFRPAAAILAYTLSDYHLLGAAAADASAVQLFEASNVALLGTARPTEEQLTSVSPALHVSEKTPPTFLWATSQDHLVPVQQSLRMASALADGGVPFELHVFEAGEHGLSLADQTSSTDCSQLDPDTAKWAGLAAAWLHKRFALPLPNA